MPNADDSKSYNPYLVLINWFASETEQCRLRWNIEGDAITASASVPPLVSLRFAMSDNASGNKRWSSFFRPHDVPGTLSRQLEPFIQGDFSPCRGRKHSLPRYYEVC